MVGESSAALWILILVLAASVVLLIFQFNALIRLRQMVKNGWADVDVYLKRRAELIPNLVTAVKAYASHEKTVLEAVTEARSRVASVSDSPVVRADAESKLGTSLINVLAIAENYPELKASANFIDLQQQLSESERHIASARQYYNACVRDYNTKIELFPSNVVATIGGFRQAEYFELDSLSERDAPKVETA